MHLVIIEVSRRDRRWWSLSSLLFLLVHVHCRVCVSPDLPQLQERGTCEVSYYDREREIVDQYFHFVFVAGRNEKESAADFFQNVMATTSTLVLWPSKLKIGAKSKKGPIPIPPFSIPSFFHAPFLHFPIISFFHTPFLHSLFPHSFIPHSSILPFSIPSSFPHSQTPRSRWWGCQATCRRLVS